MPIEGLNINISPECGLRLLSAAPTLFDQLRYFDTVFGRPFRCFSITLTAILSLSDRYKMFTSDWLWIEVCRNVVFSRNRYHYDNNKQKTLKSIKSEFCAIWTCYWKSDTRNFRCGVKQITFVRTKKLCMSEFEKTKMYSRPYIFNSRDKVFNKIVLNNSH